VGYFTDTAGVVGQVRFDQVTHLNYAFALPKPDGTVSDISNGWKLRDLVAKAHENNVQVLISVGGWGTDREFEALAADPVSRSTFVNQMVEFVERYQLDGVDIDWEYPDPNPTDNNSAQNYLDLMRELHEVLHPPGKLLTTAVPGLHGDGFLPESFAYLDFVNVMVYDGSGDHHSPYSYAVEAISYWQGRGLPVAKTMLGVPFYGRPNDITYRELVEYSADTPYADEIDYYGNPINYNGIETMRKKTELALERASGIMIWTLAGDTSDDETSLLNVIHQTAYGP